MVTTQIIEWKDEYQTGIPLVDDSHRELVDLINRLYEHLQTGRSGATVVDFLGELYATVKTHFVEEEEIMNSLKYDEVEHHSHEHEKLLDEICEIMFAYQDGVVDDIQSLAGRLDDWFSTHFHTQDVRLQRFIDAQPDGDQMPG